ncbi:CHAT domain-containing protein [Ideonella sp. A 288]|uniref:CHAT domain-containing protein n=1 Tax=Ideonella sp. A 288 TaxID=1962181 RepID=UPI000B4BA209|nr:CHAT domain-containing protein [Ideonella sp. A 288]
MSALEHAWALKDACYAAWARDPAAARAAADELATLAATVPHEPAVQALAAWTRGIAELAAGALAAALGNLQRAAGAFAASGDRRREAEAQVPQLMALALLGRHDEAVVLGEHTRAVFAAEGDEAAAGRVELNLASMLMQRDRYAEAAAMYRAAALRFARSGDRQHSVMADVGLADALAWQFEFDEAERIHERAAQRAAAHGLLALRPLIDASRGRMALHRGQHAQALAHLVAALSATQAQGQRQLQGEAERQLADAYAALHLWPEAQALYDRAVDTAQALDTPIERAWALVQRADVLAARGVAEAAAADLAAARALFDGQGNAVGSARVALQAAAVALGRGDAIAALADASRAAAVFAGAGVRSWHGEAEVLAGESLQALARPAEAAARFVAALTAADGVPEIEAACHTGLGRSEADPAAARARFQQAVACIERQRAALAGDEFRIAYGSGRRTAHEALVQLALDEGDPEALFAAMEGARAQAMRHSAAADEAPAAAAERERWRWLHGQWRQALAGSPAARAADLQQRMQAAEHDWLEAERRARATGPGGTAAASLPTLDRLQAALPRDGALVEYVQAGDRLAACVVTPGRVEIVALDGSGLAEQIERLRLQLDTLRHGTHRLQRHAGQLAVRARAHLTALHARLWAPLLSALGAAWRVIVVPHRNLHYVPFAALHDGRSYLVERAAPSLAPSAALWLAAQPRQAMATASRVLALGHGGTALPHVYAELDAVADAFGPRARVLRDGDATLTALRQHLPDTDVLHLACHGEFRADSPYFSALHLADGPLTLRDAAELPLAGTRLVTLSACETGLSRIAPGDELLGLVRGFLLAGASAVLASQWTVEDEATADLMGAFYRRLCAGTGAAEALQAAQCEMLARHPNPWHWSAFSLNGLR